MGKRGISPDGRNVGYDKRKLLIESWEADAERRGIKLMEPSCIEQAAKAERVKIVADQYSLRIYINYLLHLNLDMADCKGFQSWIDNTGFYCIEYYGYKANPILTEYEDRGLWEEILKKLDDKI